MKRPLSNTARVAFRILAALATIALGGLVGLFAFGLVWGIWDGFLGPGAATDYRWIQIGSIAIEGWKIYACATAAAVTALALFALGWFFFPRRKTTD